jgi:nicotinamide-nucleotide amidase
MYRSRLSFPYARFWPLLLINCPLRGFCACSRSARKHTRAVNVELINTGSELMLGRVLNTHQQWLCRRLADLGYIVTRQVAVADTAGDIEQAVREALSRATLVITTGGLGPTSDDITRDLIAQLLGKKLQPDATIARHIESFFAARKRPMPASTLVQAMVPEGAIVLPNPNGTAPGLAIKVARSAPLAIPPQWLIMLPGPPRELRPMFNATVVPLLHRELPLEAEFVCRTLRTVGIGESQAADRIGSRLLDSIAHGLELGYCAHVGAVDVRLAAKGPQAAQLVSAAEAIVRAELSKHIFGTDDETLEAVVIRLLTERQQTLTLAESCTGGGIANRITNVPGASVVLLASLVTYANAAKQKFVGVRSETLATHGAVSEAVAREMAEGARRETGADYALSVTGIAGPGGGSEAKPVGTVFIGFASAHETIALKQFNPFDRETFKQVTGTQALELLRRKVLALD